MKFVPFTKEWWFDLVISCLFGALYGWLLTKLLIPIIGTSIITVLLMILFVLFTADPLWKCVRERIPAWPYNV